MIVLGVVFFLVCARAFVIAIQEIIHHGFFDLVGRCVLDGGGQGWTRREGTIQILLGLRFNEFC